MHHFFWTDSTKVQYLILTLYLANGTQEQDL